MTYRYLLFYKPYNVLSQFTDTQATNAPSANSPAVNSPAANSPAANSRDRQTPRQTLGGFIDVPGVYAVGRLDRDSEGLLLLTDDGAMQHRLSHPKFGHWRQYWVQVEQASASPPIKQALAQLRKGVTIRGYRTRPAQAEEMTPPDIPPRNPPIRYRKQIPTTWFDVRLSEGKNRQVRRMTAAVGFPTLRLIRYGMWLTDSTHPESKPLTLCGLQPGEWRELTADEVRSLPRKEIADEPKNRTSKNKAHQNKAHRKSSAKKPSAKKSSAKKSSVKKPTRRSSARKSRTRK